jgi:hypothetical protein
MQGLVTVCQRRMETGHWQTPESAMRRAPANLLQESTSIRIAQPVSSLAADIGALERIAA